MIDVGLVASGHLPTAIEIEGSEVGWAIIDADYVYRAVNRALARQNGIDGQEHVGRTIDEVLPRSAKVIRRLLDEARETRRPIVDEGLVWIDALGNERGAVVTYTPDFRRADGRHLGWTALVRPVDAAEALDRATALRAVRRLRARVDLLSRDRGTDPPTRGGEDQARGHVEVDGSGDD